MRSIKQTAAFKRDLKREAKGANRHAVTHELFPVAPFMTNLLRTRFVHGSYVGRTRFIRESYIGEL